MSLRSYLKRNISQKEKLEQKPTRDGYGKGLVELGKKNPNVIVLTADLAESTRTHWFQEKFPERFIECGVAEQNMVGIAAGLALSGKIPFASSFAVFCPGSTVAQLRLSVCYGNVNVKIAGSHAGISVGADGASHQGLEDIALTRCVPNLTVLAPCDYLETKKATIAAAKINGPVYLRFARPPTPVFTTEKTPFKIGRAEVFQDGKDVAILACGSYPVYNSIVAAEDLSKEGIDVRVINNHTIKPLDEKTIIRAAKETRAIVTAEEHQVMGGMGSAIAEVLAKNYPVPIEMIGIQDKFGESGEAEELIEEYGLGASSIKNAVRRVLNRKIKNQK